MAKLLTPKEIDTRLKKLDVQWSALGGNQLSRVFEFADFKNALAYVMKLGVLAEKFNHHPDIKLAWGKVEISLTTHSEGGLTSKDFNLATAIDNL